MNTVTSVAWPLLFTYRGMVLGNGFLADVELCGRLLASPETEGVWLDGVNPGAFAMGALNLEEANRLLGERLTRVFVDFAEQTASFPAFQAAIQSFYETTDPETVTEWEQAVTAVRCGHMPVPVDLPRNPGWTCFVRVIEKALHQITAQDNPSMADTRHLAAAA